MAADPPPEGPSPPRRIVRRILARDGWAILVASAATVAIELGVFAAARLAGAGSTHTVLATLAVTVLWVALAAGVLAAPGADTLAAFLRGGCIADASAVTLIVLWLAAPEVTFLAAVKIYCVLVAMALLGVSVSRLAHRPAGRYASAVVLAAVLLVTLASPFWIGGAVRSSSRETAESVLAVGVYLNPFYAVTGAIVGEAQFVWHQHGGLMYQQVARGYYSAAPAACWYASVLIHGLGVVVVGVVAGLLGRRRRDRVSAAITYRHDRRGGPPGDVRSS